MHYYAFVTRDADKRYRAELPDFPDCLAQAHSLAALPPAIVATVRRHADAQRHWTLPFATPFGALPRMADALDGFWISVDLSSCMAISACVSITVEATETC
ncbi:type II toxin-antitoxin system HicB family antitoxin [Cognatilysobacter bugurensis]|uniref:HicB-like antitoxin of toxin-antitoxin system domain-containing protein n=1 Tax=Cognatilysobacter bugurensis TaxID=543356 RepID=A0A918W999_9GAMM|nr:type II toxin-antitoxin system HicB family antitoxin [Lysobacter bugurensis]GHA84047.1 hypothetical protein GCM10007067_22790 [Lysobacter bugurensis]